MPLLYERTESKSQVEIRLSAGWYVVRYGLLALLLVAVVGLETLEGSPVMPVVATLMFGVMAVRLIGFWPARREILDAMRRDTLSIAGSSWNPKRPLRYRFRRQPPPAKASVKMRGD